MSLMQLTVNGQLGTHEVSNLSGLLDELGLTQKPCAVEVNRELVPASAQAWCPLHEGDRIEIVTFVGGG